MTLIHNHKEFVELTADRDALLEKVKGLETEVANMQNMSVDLTTKQAQHDNVIKTMKAEHEAAINKLRAEQNTALEIAKNDYELQISQLNTKVETETASAEKKAQTIVAQMGLPADKLPANTENDTTQILDNMKGMSPSQLSEYFMKHRKQVFAALKAKTKAKE